MIKSSLVIIILLTLPWSNGHNHIDTPYYKVILTSSYEDDLQGVHLSNKQEQDDAMSEFVAGRLAPGEMGNGIELENMVAREKKRREVMYQAHGFDEYISEHLVSLNRTLPDRREEWCKTPRTGSELPATSIIIIFHNEAWSTLMRTVFSVLNRSPEHLVQEIILVDDASTLDHLQERLQHQVDRMNKVKLVRMRERGGLMRARMAGIEAAQAEVINSDWLILNFTTF